MSLSFLTFFDEHPKKAHTVAALILLMVVTGMFWRVIFLGETLVDAATLQNQLPWGATGPTFLDHSYNRRDITDTYITREYFLVDSFKHGEWPMWSPYNFTGHPVYADGVFRMLSPFNVFYLMFDVPRAYDLTSLLQLFLTGLFAYLFFVKIKLKSLPSLLGAVTFMLASLTLFHVTSSGWLGGLMWLPLIFLGMDRALERNSLQWAALAGICFALQFYCGYMANAIYYLGAIVTYYVFQSIELSSVSPPNFKALVQSIQTSKFKVQNIKFLAVTLIVGFALSAAQWMPIFELLGFSNRKIVPTELQPNWLPPWYLITTVLPHVFGEAYDPKFAVLFVGIGVSHAHSVYFGIAGLFLAGFGGYLWLKRSHTTALASESRSRLSYFLLLLLVSTLVMCAVPLYVHITKYIPVLQTIRVTNRVSVLFTFSFAAVVAIGAHHLLTAERELVDGFLVWVKRVSILVLSGCVVLMITVSVVAQTSWYQHRMNTFDAQRRILRAPLALSENFDVANLDYFPATVIPLVLMAVVWILLVHWRTGKLTGEVLLGLLLVISLGDLAWNGSTLNESYDRSLVYHESAAIQFLHSDPGLFRVVVAPANFSTKGQVSQLDKIVAPPNTLVPYRIQTISGKDQLFPRWYREMASTIHPQNYLSHVVFNTVSSPWYDLWNVKYIVTNDDLRIGDDGYLERFTGEGIRIYENTRAKPRAFFIPRAIGMPETPLARKKTKTPDEVVKKIKAPDFNPLELAYVQGEGAQGEVVYTPSPDDLVKVISYRNNEVELSAKSTSGGVLMLTDTYYPGWNVYVDDVQQPLWRADHALRAVKLNPGPHKVLFKFEPLRFRLGCSISLIFLVGMLGLMGLGFVWQKRHSGVAG